MERPARRGWWSVITSLSSWNGCRCTPRSGRALAQPHDQRRATRRGISRAHKLYRLSVAGPLARSDPAQPGAPHGTVAPRRAQEAFVMDRDEASDAFEATAGADPFVRPGSIVRRIW